MELNNEWNIEVDIDKNIDNQYIITKLSITPKENYYTTTGITASTFRDISISDLLSRHTKDQENFTKLDEDTIQNWIESMKGRSWGFTRPIPDYVLARLAYLYVHLTEMGSLKPIKILSDNLEASTKAVAQRIQLARKRGMLTSATFLTAPRGKPLGKLTPKALELLDVK